MTPGIPQQSSLPVPTASNDWFGHTWRLVGWNIQLAWRRLMSKILLAILLVGFALLMGGLLLTVAVFSNVSTSVVVTCPSPVATTEPGSSGNPPEIGRA